MAITPDIDVRLFDVTGKRKRLPSTWLESVDFSLSERGGCIDGQIALQCRWENLQLAGTEYVDISLWGSLIYRGWVRQPQNDIGIPERATLNLYGGMELLNGYQVQRNYAFLPGQSIELVFLALVQDFALRSYPVSRLTGWTTDYTGVAALGITVAQFQPSGRTLSQALNDLCDLAPGQLIWGCEIDGSGNNRIYLRPRVTAVTRTYVVGKNVTMLTYPVDATQVVNRVIVTGGPIQPPNLPNLLSNPSFEEITQPGESTSNLLLNPGFEANNSGSPNNWVVGNNPTVSTVTPRTGSNSLDMDNNPSAPESIYQDVLISGAQLVYQSCWANISTGTATLTLSLQAFDGGNNSLGTANAVANLNAATMGAYVWQHIQTSWTMPANTAKVRVTYELTTLVGGGAINVDDCSFWTQQTTSKNWALGLPSGAYVNAIQWDFGNYLLDANEQAPFDGDLMIKCQPVITGGAGSYVEITTDTANQVSINAYTTYTVAFRLQTGNLGSAGSAACGVRIYNSSGGLVSTNVATATAITKNAWTTITYQFTTTSAAVKCVVFVRLYTGDVYYIDGAQMTSGLIGGTYGQTLYTRDGTYRGVRDVTNYSSGQIGTAQAASITTWGEREAAISNNDVVDEASMDAFAIGYLSAYAVPQVQARLTIDQATAPILLDGAVAISNLPSAPAAAFPSKVNYRVGAGITIDADLNKERPDFAQLLRLVAGAGTGAYQ